MWTFSAGFCFILLFLTSTEANFFVIEVNKDTNLIQKLGLCRKDDINDIASMLDAISANLSQQINKVNERFENEILNKKHQTKNVEVQLPKPTSCSEAMSSDNKDGIYEIYIPDSGLNPFKVYCIKDPDNGPPWTMFQRRQDNSTNFYRGWHEYRRGFGNLEGEHFLGLEKIHAITAYSEPQQLWIQMGDFDGETRYAKYSTFEIDDDKSNYKLQILGDYSGTAGGDSMKVHQGMQFTTKDSNNDKSDINNCAELYKGGWWFNKCHDCNLNGPYLAPNGERAKGIIWFDWNGSSSLKYVHMALRPIN